MESAELPDQFAQLARTLRNEPTEPATLEHAVQLAVEIIEGCDDASFSLIRGRQIQTAHSTSPEVERADQLQHDLDQGPCLDTIRHDETTYGRDLATDPRWPHWGHRVAHELGLRSLLSFQLFTDGDDYGALNLYSHRVDGFDSTDHATGLAMAAHIAVALSASRVIDNLRVAIGRRTLIGQAQGILMERYELDAAQAFSFLRRVSNETQHKIYDLAEHLATTRQLPPASQTVTTTDRGPSG